MCCGKVQKLIKDPFVPSLNVIDVGQALRKRVAHPLSCFQRRGDQSFFIFLEIHFLVILRKMHSSLGSWQFSICSGGDIQNAPLSLSRGTRALDIV